MAHSSDSVTVPTSVTANGSRSARSSRHSRAISRRSIKPQATTSNNPAITANGSSATQRETKSSSSTRNSAALTAARGVRAPASTLTPERLNEPLLGIAEKKAPARLARPWPTNSRLPSSVSPNLRATALAMAAASVSASKVITSVAPNRLRTVSIDRSGHDNGGRAPGSAGTVASGGHAGMAARSASDTNVPATTATSIAGT